MKFPSDSANVGRIRGDQKSVRSVQCLGQIVLTVREENHDALGALVQPALGVVWEEDELDSRVRVERIIEPMEEVEEISIHDENPAKVIKENFVALLSVPEEWKPIRKRFKLF
uniref:Uncharacterized protein n=1 Tax=Cannabis sativa TaxID=3483 RepID=A0A803NJH9_CANSA